MTVSDRTELVTALAEYRAKDLLGTPEAGWVDFKRSPYLLDTRRGKWELAKDVAAMANATGGLLVLGVGTTRQPNDIDDVASALSPFRRDLVKIDAMKGVLTDWIVPPQRPGLAWFAAAAGSEEFYLVVTVEPLPERDRYALVSRTVDEDGKETQSFGVPIRQGDETEWLTAEHVRILIRDGLSHRAALAANPPPHAPAPAPVHAETSKRRARNTSDLLTRWQALDVELPVLRLTSWVEPQPPALPGLYAADGVRGYLDGPHALRPLGFHFHNPYRQTEVLPGALGLNSRPGLAVLVAQDATVTAGIAANRTLLARSNEGGSELPVSSIVLTELLYEYFRLVDEQVAPRAPGTWTHRLRAWRFRSNNVTLAPGTPSTRWADQAQVAVQDDYDVTFVGQGEAAVDAATAVGLFYNLFGLDGIGNPFIDDGKIDVDGFVATTGS